jgi:hypothetical protein
MKVQRMPDKGSKTAGAVVLNWRRAPAASLKWLIGRRLALLGEGVGERGIAMMEEAARRLVVASRAND